MNNIKKDLTRDLLYKKVMSTIKKYNMLENNDRVVLGLSGGADSITLFYVLLEIKKVNNIDIIAVHVNHNLRENAICDQKFVNDLCNDLNIKIINKSIPTKEYASENKLSIEESARVLRYKAFDEVLQEFDAQKIAIAHNKNDSVETTLFNLMRGSSLKGLSGISATRYNIIRPLIEVTKEDIREFLIRNQFDNIEDETNDQNIYTRNKVRNELLPLMKRFNPNLIDTIYSQSKILELENEFLEKETLNKYLECVFKGQEESEVEEIKDKKLIVDLNIFSKIDYVLQRRIILKCLKELSISNYTKKMVENILELKDLKGEKYFYVNDFVVKKQYDKIVFETKREANGEIDFSFNVVLTENELVDVSKNLNYLMNDGNEYLIGYKLNEESMKKVEQNYKKITEILLKYGTIKDISLRTRLSGDYFLFQDNQNGNENVKTKKIKDYFIDNKITQDDRKSTLMFAIDNQILSIIEVKKDLETKKIIFKNKLQQGELSGKITLWKR